MSENSNKIAYIVKIIRDIAIAIVAVLLIVSMVHKKYNNGFYLALPIIGSYGGFYARVGISQDYNDKLNISVDGKVDTNVRHKNSCVKGYEF